MKTIRNMIELSVSYDGKISVKNIEPTQSTEFFLYYWHGDGEHGVSCYCPEDKKRYYLNRLLNAMKKEVDENYEEAKTRRDKIYAMIQEVKKNELVDTY